MKKILTIYFATLVTLMPALSLAQTFNVPQPIKDFVDTTKNINVQGINPIDINKIVQSGENANSQELISKLQGWWYSINSWMSSHIGVSFSEIIKGIGGIIVWALKIIVSLVQRLLSLIN